MNTANYDKNIYRHSWYTNFFVQPSTCGEPNKSRSKTPYRTGPKGVDSTWEVSNMRTLFWKYFKEGF